MNTDNKVPRIALGPVLYYWPEADLHTFYDQIAGSSVDIVYLGETICNKRRGLNYDGWLAIADKLAAAGKTVVLSAMTLLEAESDLKFLRRLCANDNYPVEANDMASVRLLAGKNPFIAGPGINCYNPRTLAVLARQGMQRWVLPVELGRESLAAIQQQRPAGVETEIFAYGRLPLAYSARCYTARHYNLPKDDCQLRCLDHPDGLSLKTQEGQAFLALNGIQTLSAQTHSLLMDLEDALPLGIDVLRISPQSHHTVKIIEVFHQAVREPSSAVQLQQEITPLMPGGPCNGYWHNKPGIEQLTAG